MPIVFDDDLSDWNYIAVPGAAAVMLIDLSALANVSILFPGSTLRRTEHFATESVRVLSK